ncbi:uncharacterized protein GGS22DRAFT_79437 [Annulohypoxylon maeteangense]|uniref:uncharacterized protein n=1 Tax=Annulohypoxylon maeteangense TaxID=1927788 RepID=UPI0020081158|nr:uncharacterized protein GGS22DRAFT_79437 [Annulohypoxylon maeteangense]KAI0880740.1 hypothetical protein GGS22DRAFT_79437 [Annulohypoxylon maeteangense]
MTESSPAPDRPFDPSKPFEGLVLCCTSIEADLRTKIAQQTADLGGIHKYDLTPDVTHLIVGDYDTAKYRHVARERPDIKPMAAGWVDAVRVLWLEDTDFDFDALENTWKLKTFEAGGGIPNSPVVEQRERIKLICCLTGFEDNETRSAIESKVKANGGEYVGDLSRAVTHLIVNKPEGKKYIAARKWRIRTVSVEWLHDSVERGMILNEECYDPTLPAEERGKDAWIRRDLRRGASLGKRPRDGAVGPSADDGRRKLRKTASMKLTSQKDNLWGDILVNQSSTDLSKSMITTSAKEMTTGVPPTLHSTDLITPPSGEVPRPNHVQQVESGVFSSCRFYIHGFSQGKQEILGHHILSHDGRVTRSIEDAALSSHNEPLDRRYLIVPQTSQPESHPELPEGMHIVTEFYIERCVHNKTLFKPDDHVLGQPFPRFPIEGFQDLAICTAGFRNEQLNQVQKAITQLGAKYSERLNSQCSLLVCPSLDQVRKQKLDFATISKIPIVSADWLWQCITTGCFVPWRSYLCKELAQATSIEREALKNKEKDIVTKSKSEPAHKILPKTRPSAPVPTSVMKHGIDMTAFDDDTPMLQDATMQEQETNEANGTNYETAPTHQTENQTENINVEPTPISKPLSEMTPNALNKSPSPQKTSPQKTSPTPRKFKRVPTGGEVGDSDGCDDSDTPIPPLQEDDGFTNKEEEQRKRQAKQSNATELDEMSKMLNSLVSRDGVVLEGDSLKPQPAPGQRRQRKILGRAASNVSATSSASAESSTHATSSKPNFRRAESIASRLDSVQTATGAFGLLDKMMEPSDDSYQATRNGDSPPRATQLEYDKSESRQLRDAYYGRISKQGNLADGQPNQEKVSLASLKNDAGLGGNTQRSSTRRSAKRR